MIKFLIFSVSFLIVFASILDISAQEKFSSLQGENVEEWHQIASSLISNNKYEESIKYYDRILKENPEDQRALLNIGSVMIQLEKNKEANVYYDKILEINPNNANTLASKGIALSNLQKFSDAYLLIEKASTLEPENETIKSKKANFLSGAPTDSAYKSKYDIEFRVTVRDVSGNLVAVAESTNTRFLPYPITDKVFAEGFDTKDTVMIDGKLYERVQKYETFGPWDDIIGMFFIFAQQDGYIINIFEAFSPYVAVQDDDVITAEWTILKEAI